MTYLKLPLPKIAFFDIDDTLYIKKEARVPVSAVNALKALKDKGVVLAIATGRGRSVFPSDINRLIKELKIEIVITINGQYSQMNDELLAHFPLDEKQVASASEYLTAHNVPYAYMTADRLFAFDERIIDKNGTSPLHLALSELFIPYTLTTPEAFDKSLPVYQVLAFYDDNGDVADFKCDLLNLKTIRWHKYGVDVLDINGSKARAVQAVLDKLGISASGAMAFGDGLNDIEMLTLVGCGVAMGNGHDRLKAAADFVCGSASEDGIWQFLKSAGLIDK